MMRRSGISLLEVLISMFVLAVGLLSMAALIPVGRTDLVVGIQADRTAVVAEAAFHDLKVRRMLDPSTWARSDGTAVYDSTTRMFTINHASGTSYQAPYAPAVAFDPLGVAKLRTYSVPALADLFPYCLDPQEPAQAPNPASPAMNPIVNTSSLNQPSVLDRLTFGPGLNAAARDALADSVMRCEDDLVFNLPSDRSQLPIQQMQGSSKRLAEGNYTWMFTLIPEPYVISDQSPGVVSQPSQYTASVMVYVRRDLSMPSIAERGIQFATFTGGDGLQIGLDASTTTQVKAEKILAVKPRQWLMIAGWYDFADNGVQKRKWYYKWYRVISAGRDVYSSGGKYVRDLSLNGPDWDVANVPASQTTAWVFDGLVGVYERQVHLETE